MSLKTVRGTHDLIPDECAKHLQVIAVARAQAELFGFQEMATPIFEFSDVFSRTLGDASDIVTKEMYSFQDKGGDGLTLRPEGTAGIVRAYISEGLSQISPFKVFYQGPMFRYERPQKGRQRQFHQLGVELMGVASGLADVECIALAHEILGQLKVRNLTRLEINSIGDKASRKSFREALKEFLSAKIQALSEDSQRRLTLNPLRILDSKDPKDIQALQGAPEFSSFLSSESQDMFALVQEGLQKLNIEFQINPNLVRGLDYYCHVVFEFKTNELGAQDAVLSGGRYDELVELMGGPSTPGVGWAAGVERLVLLAALDPTRERPITLVPLGDLAELEALKVAQELRRAGLHTELTMSGNLSRRMKKAATWKSRWALILGDDEIQAETVVLKDLDSGQQQTLARKDLIAHLKK